MIAAVFSRFEKADQIDKSNLRFAEFQNILVRKRLRGIQRFAVVKRAVAADIVNREVMARNSHDGQMDPADAAIHDDDIALRASGSPDDELFTVDHGKQIPPRLGAVRADHNNLGCAD